MNSESKIKRPVDRIAVALLTGGSDRPYVYGLTKVLLTAGVQLDLIGSDELIFPEFAANQGLSFLNLRGSQNTRAGILEKTVRICKYYVRLLRYAASAKPKLFHILWNNRFEYFDRTLLMLYYKLLGKKILFTAHNVNANKRDSRDSRLNRLTLGIQYRFSDCIFVHTEKMKQELASEFDVEESKISVIPFGINNAVPNTALTPEEAKKRLGVGPTDRTLLFFGRITPYKGVEYLIDAFRRVSARNENYKLLIAGRVDRAEAYWMPIKAGLANEIASGKIVVRDHFIPDEETEIYFKAADALVLPYKDIYQSGVLFLAHSFGLPVLAADVGSLADDIIPDKTGFAFAPENSVDLARVIEQYFSSSLYANLGSRRADIQEFTRKTHSWSIVAETTQKKYAELLKHGSDTLSNASLDLTLPS